MPYRIVCNGVQREGAKLSPDLASELFCYVPLHTIRYGIPFFSILLTAISQRPERVNLSERTTCTLGELVSARSRFFRYPASQGFSENGPPPSCSLGEDILPKPFTPYYSTGFILHTGTERSMR